MIQFCLIRTQFTFLWLIDRTLSGTTTLGQSGPGSNGNEEVLCIPQISSITVASPSGCFLSYPRYSLRGVLYLCQDAVGVFYSPSRLAKKQFFFKQFWIA